MERTLMPTEEEKIKMYGSDTNVSKMKDKHVILSEWVNPRKKRVYESEGELSTGQISAVQKPACCTENMLSSLKETMDSLREEMKIMMHTLKEMKDQQETRFGNFEKDMSDIKITICQLQKTNEVVDDSLDYLGKKCSKLENAIEEANNVIKIQENKIKDLSQKNVYLEKYNKALEERVCMLEQKGLDCNIELLNVQAPEGMSTIQIARAVADELNLCPEKITKAWRVGKIKDGKDSRPIIVTLQTREDRIQWIGCRKNAITNSAIFKNNNNTRIYINENITQHLRRLFWEVKTELKDLYKYIWIQNARILIRKNDTVKKIHQIRTQSDIKAFLENKKQE